MYGHALRVLADRGYDVAHLLDRATRGLKYFFKYRLDAGSGLVRVVHPWETGCDDSPRWDGLRSVRRGVLGRYERKRSYATKVAMVRSLEKRDGSALYNPHFDVCSIGFAALVAFNACELSALTNDAELLAFAGALASAIERRWVDEGRIWCDLWLSGPSNGATVRTLDALLPVLVSKHGRAVDAAFEDIADGGAFWRPYGPTGTAVTEPTYQPSVYWRGPVWPHLSYLVMIAASRAGRTEAAIAVAKALIRGCVASRFSEYWHPETGKAKGATPQGWAALASDAVLFLEEIDELPSVKA